MKGKVFRQLEVGTAAYVVAHAEYRRSRGKNRPSMAYVGVRNPDKALALAREVLVLGDKTQEISKEEYRARLARLPIENPTAKDMADMCPHLTPEEAVKAFYGCGNSHGYVACPPLRVRNAFQIVNFSPGFSTEDWRWNGSKRVKIGSKKRPPKLYYAYAGRMSSSYANGKSRRHYPVDYAYMHAAAQYADKRWGSDLILDGWFDVCEIILEDPSRLVNNRYAKDSPTYIQSLYMTLSRGYNDFCNDIARPLSERFDEFIIEMTTDIAEWHELKGDRGGYSERNCAYCGSGLGLSGCGGCGHSFRDNHIRNGWHTPLSRRMVEFLEAQGHRFKKDPMYAWAKEKSEFKVALEAEEKFLKSQAERLDRIAVCARCQAVLDR